MKLDRAVVDLAVSGKDPHDRFGCDGFSGTGFTDDGDRFASMEIQVDAADGFDISVVSFKRNIEVADF